MNDIHVLVCDDESELREMVGEYLQKRGFSVTLADGANELDAHLAGNNDINVVLLDINMPGEDGLSVLRRIRVANSLPVIMLTAAGEPVDRVLGLEMGADDYLAKPVDLRELEARIKAVLRRTGSSTEPSVGSVESGTENANRVVQFDGLALDIDRAELLDRDGSVIELTAMEFTMLEFFSRNQGRVLNRDQLMESAFDREWDPFDRSIDIRILRLRKKIERNPAKPKILRTVRGLGYKFDPGNNASD